MPWQHGLTTLENVHTRYLVRNRYTSWLLLSSLSPPPALFFFWYFVNILDNHLRFWSAWSGLDHGIIVNSWFDCEGCRPSCCLHGLLYGSFSTPDLFATLAGSGQRGHTDLTCHPWFSSAVTARNPYHPLPSMPLRHHVWIMHTAELRSISWVSEMVGHPLCWAPVSSWIRHFWGFPSNVKGAGTPQCVVSLSFSRLFLPSLPWPWDCHDPEEISIFKAV